MKTSPQILVDIDPPIATIKDVAGRRLKVHLTTGEATLVFPLDESVSSTGTHSRSEWPQFPGNPRVIQKKGMRVVGGVGRVPLPIQMNVDSLLFFPKRDFKSTTPTQDATKSIAAVTEWLDIFRSWLA